MDKSLIKVAAMAREWSSVFLQQFSSVKGRHTTGKIWKMSCDITCIAHHTCTIYRAIHGNVSPNLRIAHKLAEEYPGTQPTTNFPAELAAVAAVYQDKQRENKV